MEVWQIRRIESFSFATAKVGSNLVNFEAEWKDAIFVTEKSLKGQGHKNFCTFFIWSENSTWAPSKQADTSSHILFRFCEHIRKICSSV